jgi:monothiol glutaredoxin
MNESTQRQLTDLITSNRVVLFMKGTRDAPSCGFSAKVVQTLNLLIAEYVTVNVLTSPTIREAIKQFSNWPTIPQLFVDGHFIGGCDTVTELNTTGELGALLGVDRETKNRLIERELDLANVCRCSDKKGTSTIKLDTAM